MRQDPEVILVGEIRDAETVETVFQAALTGHLVLSTFHAGSAAGAISRLLDMGIEPYLLTSGLRAVLHQRLVRRLCDVRHAGRRIADSFSACQFARRTAPPAASLPPHRLSRPAGPGRDAAAAGRRAGPGRLAAATRPSWPAWPLPPA